MMVTIKNGKIEEGKRHEFDTFKVDSPRMSVSIFHHEVCFYQNKNLAEYSVVAETDDKKVVGGGTLLIKTFEHMKIGCIAQMVVDPAYRKNGISREIMLHFIGEMYRRKCDISMLYASVLKVYESVGYKAYYKNMMLRGIMKEVDLSMLLNLYNSHKTIGYF